MNRLYAIYDRANKATFEIIDEDKRYRKKDIDEGIEYLESELLLIVDNLTSKRVYIDIKDRFLFIVLFLTLKKLDASVVLIPIEIQPDVFYEDGIVYITDNKKFPNSLYVNTDFNIIAGDEFNKDKLSDFDKINDIYLFTSGSTGKSKLIGKSSGNIITEAMELYRIFKPSPKKMFYFTAPLYHIYGFLFGLILPMYSSSIIDLTYHFSPESIAEYVKSEKTDYFISTPSYYKMLETLSLQKYFKKVSNLFSSSAPLPVSVSESFFKNGAAITEVYGSTETGGIAYRVSAENIQWKMFSYVSIILQDKNDEAELIIDSPAISVDYDKKSGYNTGDLARFHDGTSFTLIGRNTRFVKIHGKRVDLGFISSRVREFLKEEYNIRLNEDELYTGVYDEKIYLFTDKKINDTTHNIVEKLRHILPGYAVPRVIISDGIPRNEMGKINKNRIDEIIRGLL